ncbi:MAG: TlpA family protein disulfide reductase [Armatimonadetes bacterium]|nr:TlpA family protein disulfide reductase [Armatimonadota bacterium]
MTLRMLLLILALTPCLAGCESSNGQSREAGGDEAPKAEAKELVVPIIRDAAGLKQELAKLQGKVVVLNFWATWCPSCVEEFPTLIKLRDRYADQNVVLLTVSGDDEADLETKVKPFLKKQGITEHAVLIAVKDEVKFIDEFHHGWNGAYPSTFVYAANGKMVKLLEGEQKMEAFEAAVKQALAAP